MEKSEDEEVLDPIKDKLLKFFGIEVPPGHFQTFLAKDQAEYPFSAFHTKSAAEQITLMGGPSISNLATNYGASLITAEADTAPVGRPIYPWESTNVPRYDANGKLLTAGLRLSSYEEPKTAKQLFLDRVAAMIAGLITAGVDADVAADTTAALLAKLAPKEEGWFTRE